MKGDNLTTQAKTYIYNHCFSENSPSDLQVQFWPNCMNYKGLYEMENWKIQIILQKNLERPYMQGMCELQSWAVSCKSVTGGKTQHVHIKPVQKGYKIYHYNLEIPAYHYLERKN